MIQTYTYSGISNTNYNQDGFFHETGSRNTLVNLMARKVFDQPTRLRWQVSFSPVLDNFPEKYWADVTWWAGNPDPVNLPVEKVSGTPVEWGYLLNYMAPFAGVTGVRIVPQDDRTHFVMTIVEYFSPTQVAQLGSHR